MKNTYRWLLVIAVLSGISFEFMKESAKRLEDQSNQTNNLSAAQIAELDIRPYHNAAETDVQSVRNKPRRKYTRNSNYKWPENHSFSHKPENKKKKKAKKKKDDKKKKKAKKKKDDKKKKKEDKKTEIADIADEFDFENDNLNETPQPETSGGDVVAAGGGFLPNQEQEDPDNGEIPLTYEEWAELVLSKPSLSATTKLVKYYQTNLVDPGIFYEILSAMIEDSRKDMRLLAITAASATPSFASFTILTQLMDREGTGSEVWSKANQKLAEYENVGQLTSLQQVIASNAGAGDKAILKLALQLLQRSAEKNLSEETIIFSEDPNIPPRQRHITTFRRFRTTLESVLQTNSGEISSLAQQTLDHISSFDS